MASVIHGFIYNKDAFDKLGLKPPKTEDEFYRRPRQDQEGRHLHPAGDGHRRPVGSRHDGLPEHRPELLAGRGRPPGADRRQGEVHRSALCRHLQGSWRAWAPYMGDGYQAQKYPDSQNLFTLGRAAIYPAGSWDIPLFEQQAKFKMGAFPPPVPRPATHCYISDHTDIAMGLNAGRKNPAEARRRSSTGWPRRSSPTLYSQRAARLLHAVEQPRSTLKDPLAQEFAELAQHLQDRPSATPTRSCRAARRTWRTSCGASSAG